MTTPPPGQQPPYSGQPASGAPLTADQDRMWAMLAHLLGIVGSFVPALIIWAVFRDRGRFTEQEAKEALNFQITVAIAYIAVTITGTILLLVLIGALILQLIWVIWIVALIFSIMGGIAANKGQAYRYPMTIRFIK